MMTQEKKVTYFTLEHTGVAKYSSLNLFRGALIVLSCALLIVCACLIEGEKVNFHPRVIKNEDITNVLKVLSKAVISQEGHMKEVLKKFEPFRELWDKDREVKYEVGSCTCLIAVK